MQADRRPSGWALIGAQAGAYILAMIFALLLFLILGLGTPLLEIPALNRENFLWGRRVVTAIVLIAGGVALGAFQQNLLKKWLPQRASWLAVSGLAMPVLVLAEFWLFSRFIILAPAPYTYISNETARAAASALAGRWSLVGGFVSGLPCGLLFGMAQSALLPWRRRLWWVSSGLIWALITALLLAAQNAATML